MTSVNLSIGLRIVRAQKQGNLRTLNLTDWSKRMPQKLHILNRSESFVLKKYGLLQFCVHYWSLVAVTKRDLYSIPYMHEHTDSLVEAAVFATFGAISGYWHAESDENVRMRRFHFKAWTLQVHLFAIRIAERTWHIPTCRGRYNVIR